jgi:predicted nucleic acid-binding protein
MPANRVFLDSNWDSLIVASALESQCSILYTEDLQHGQVIDQVLTIVNPFHGR